MEPPSPEDGYERLVNLPRDLQMLFLMKLDYKQLNNICEEIQSSHDKRDQELSWFCNDPNFWYDYAIKQEYLIPETFPKLITYLQKGLQPRFNQAVIIRILLFDESSFETWMAIKLLIDNYNRDYKQIILDYFYLKQQKKKLISRKKKNKPKVFSIIWHTLPKPTNEADLIRELDQTKRVLQFSELMQIFVDYDLKLFTDGLSQIHNKELSAEIAEQNAAMIGDLLQEGDVIHVSFVNPIEDHWYYFDGQKLILIPDVEGSGYLPVESFPFLLKHKVQDITQLYKLYNEESFEYVVGIINPETNEDLDLAYRNDSTEDSHEYVKFGKNRFYIQPK